MSPNRTRRLTHGWKVLAAPVAVWLLAGGLLACGGCRKRDRAPEVFTLEGRIDDIKLKAGGRGEITATYYSEKQKQEISGTALVTPETEVIINGAVADIAQVRTGERVRADVLVERGSDEDRKHRVLKIVVHRPIEPAETGG